VKKSKVKDFSKLLVHIKNKYGTDAMLDVILMFSCASLSKGNSSLYLCSGYSMTDEILFEICRWGILDYESGIYKLSKEYK